MPYLAPPSENFQDSFLQALDESRTAPAPRRWPGVVIDFRACVRELLAKADAATLEPGRVPETIFWLVEGREYLGRASIRHELNDWLLNTGGHIGYDIRPSARLQGYGTLILRLALEKASDLGLCRVLLTCDETNTASRKIIEANGGVLENRHYPEGATLAVLRYWIETKRP